MRRIGYGVVAGLGMAGLLLVGVPARAQSGGSSGTGSSGSTTGSGSTSDQSGTGSTGSSGSSQYGGTTGQPSGTTGGTTGGMAGEATPSGKSITGTVQKFDRDTNTLSLSGTDKKLKVSEDTKVMKDGATGSLSDIKEGEQVRASYTGPSTAPTLQVTRIDVISAGGKMGGPSGGTTGGGTGGTGGSSSGGKY